MKMLSFWNQESKSVDFKCLDMDASEGDTQSCADAIDSSLQKVGGIKLQGQTTDSGGGGVLDSLADALHEKELCRNNYKVAGCTIHTFQLTLKNPVEKIFGEGGLGVKNMMQMLHAVYDMQESLEFQEYVEFTKELQQSGTEDFDYGEGVYDKEFGDRMSKLAGFYRDFQSVCFFEGKKITKMPAPILTRWWYVGEGCSFVWQYYPAILKATQIIINVYARKPNKIASGLQPLLLEQEIFADLCFVKCYHSAYFKRHMKWLQSSEDLSNRPGFQSHQVLPRFFLMRRDLELLRRKMLKDHFDFEDFRDVLDSLDETKNKTLKETLKKKAELFISVAIESLDKHFSRWANRQLLPASLLAEGPLAAVTARVMLGIKHPKMNPFKRFFVSTVHCEVFDMLEYQTFVSHLLVTEEYEGNFAAMDITAARRVLHELEDMRSFNTSKKPSKMKEYLLEMYLPLACHTQGVESAVKEAKLVSPTGRHEALRSAYAIVRSHMILSSTGTLSTTKASQRASLMLEAAAKFESNQMDLEQSMGDDEEYNVALKSIRESVHESHYKLERIGKLKENVHHHQEANKKMNAIQKVSGVDRTVATLGLLAYSSINKNKGHEAPLREELLHRKVQSIEGLGFMELKKSLMEHEVKRATTQEEKNTAKKAFMRLSNAIFVGVDIDRLDRAGNQFTLAEDFGDEEASVDTNEEVNDE